jgi:hypothetical protein
MGRPIALPSQMYLVQQLIASSVVYASIIEPSGLAQLKTYLLRVNMNRSYVHI